jgi:hypothetical protein
LLLSDADGYEGALPVRGAGSVLSQRTESAIDEQHLDGELPPGLVGHPGEQIESYQRIAAQIIEILRGIDFVYVKQQAPVAV